MSTKNIIIKWGLIGGTISVIMSLLAYLIGMADSKIFQYMSVLLMVALIIMSLNEYRDKIGSGFASFDELFKVGLLIGLIVGVISVLWFYIYISFIDVDMIPRLLLKTELELETQGLPDKDIKMAMNITKKFMTPFYMSVISIASTLFVSGIIALISALIIKNEKPIAFLDEDEK